MITMITVRERRPAIMFGVDDVGATPRYSWEIKAEAEAEERRTVEAHMRRVEKGRGLYGWGAVLVLDGDDDVQPDDRHGL